MRAARIGTADYRREIDLRRVLRLPAPPPPGTTTVRALLALEAELETRRQRTGDTIGLTWRAAQHVETLTALMAEVRLMAAAVPEPADPPRRLALIRPD